MTKKSKEDPLAGEPLRGGPEIPGAVILSAPEGITNVAVESANYRVVDGLVQATREHANLLVELWGFTSGQE